jgi:hypothetical protein
VIWVHGDLVVVVAARVAPVVAAQVCRSYL